MPTLTSSDIYYCGNENRRDLVRSTMGPGGLPALNGMDYLEIANEAQTEIQIRFVHPVPGEPDGVPDGVPTLTAENFRILGGERIRNIRVLSAASNNDQVTLTVDAAGDFSYYTLILVADSTSETPPAGYDPRLARIQFSFKAACPSPFDCRDNTICSADDPAALRIDYLARDYESYRRVLLDRLRLLMPQWEETSPADFMVGMVELLAYVGDQLTHAQESAGTEAYLGTALHRQSLRRHARLIDYRMHEGCNARTWVQMEVEPGGAAQGATVPVGTRVFAGVPEQRKLAEEGAFERLDPARSAIFETMEPLTVRSEHNRFQFYTWSDTECVLCKGACAATLVRPLDAAVTAGMALIFEEIRDPRASAESELKGRIAQRWAVRLTAVTEIEDPLTSQPLYAVEWDEADALPFSFVISRRVGSVLISDISVAYGNVVLADHGLSREDDPDDPNLHPNQAPTDGSAYTPILTTPDLTYRESLEEPATTPATRAVQQSAKQARAQLWLDSEGERWNVVLDLLGSDASAADFVVEMDNFRRAHLRFGENQNGRSPSIGQSFTARFRIGNGTPGNIGADAISAILLPGGGFRRVRNPLPAVGGTDPESLEAVRQFAPVAFRTQQRAVRLEDYEARAQTFPGVQQARARFRWLASWYTVMITVDREGGLPIDSEFRTQLLAHVDQFRMAGYDIEIRGPVYVALDIELHVCLPPEANRAEVLRELHERLGSGTKGLFHPDRLTFGQRLFASTIIAEAMKVGGVDHARIDRLKRFWEPAGTELEDGFIEATDLELFRLANDPSFPERGRIAFSIDGGF